jgi:transposase InsO family protein
MPTLSCGRFHRHLVKVDDDNALAAWQAPESLMHHSDRGSQYTRQSFQRLMKELCIT